MHKVNHQTSARLRNLSEKKDSARAPDCANRPPAHQCVHFHNCTPSVCI